MFTTDDTEIIPADQSGDAPSPNGRALTAPAPGARSAAPRRKRRRRLRPGS